MVCVCLIDHVRLTIFRNISSLVSPSLFDLNEPAYCRLLTIVNTSNMKKPCTNQNQSIVNHHDQTKHDQPISIIIMYYQS